MGFIFQIYSLIKVAAWLYEKLNGLKAKGSWSNVDDAEQWLAEIREYED